MELHLNANAERLTADALQGGTARPEPSVPALPWSRLQRAIGCLLALMLILRLGAMAALPLMDTTEARYGEIGRKMAAMGDWVTPWYDVGVPFWGKPPLSFWATAASMRWLGINEFAARLPHLLFGGLVAALVWQFARCRGGVREALLGLAMLCGSTLFFVSVGAVMTDTAMVFCTTAALYSFWFALHGAGAAERRLHGWMFFVAMGLGLLAKGPVAVVLAGLPILLWLSLQKRWREGWQALPWVRGSLVALAVAAPWYWLAEQRTPGFLNYFIIGEHWHRFVTPGWSGDQYGHAHQEPIGTIWVYAWGALLPWSVLLPGAAWYWRRRAVVDGGDEQASLRQYLWLWALVPLIFFTAARNIIWTYALPSLPAMALLMARWLLRRSPRAEAWVVAGLAVSLVGGALGLGRLTLDLHQDDRSARRLVHAYLAEARPDEALLYQDHRPYSASFYSGGRAGQFARLDSVPAMLGTHTGYLVIRSKLDLATKLSEAGLLLDHRVCCFGDEQLLRVRPMAGAASAAGH